jgi:hypothetical protein
MKTHRIPLSKEKLIELGFSDFFYYHQPFFWRWLLSLTAIAAFAFFTLKFLLDPSFHFQDHYTTFRCHAKGCGMIWLIYVAALAFFSLPLWLKLPSAIVFAINSVFGFSKKMTHYFDQKPDVAVGLSGIYCPDYFHYQEVKWSEIDRLEVESVRNNVGAVYVNSVKLFLKSDEKQAASFLPRFDRKLKIGFNWTYQYLKIIESISNNCGVLRIVDIVKEQ